MKTNLYITCVHDIITRPSWILTHAFDNILWQYAFYMEKNKCTIHPYHIEKRTGY